MKAHLRRKSSTRARCSEKSNKMLWRRSKKSKLGRRDVTCKKQKGKIYCSGISVAGSVITCRVYMFSECSHKFSLGAPASSHSETMHFYHFTIYHMPAQKFNRVVCNAQNESSLFSHSLVKIWQYGDILEHIMKFWSLLTWRLFRTQVRELSQVLV